MGRRTVGVEEELLLFDGRTTRPAPLGDEISDDPDDGGDHGDHGDHGEGGSERAIVHEFKLEQLETSTSPCRGFAELYDEVVRRRRAVAARAAEAGAVAGALATSPLKTRPTLTPGTRYARMQELFGAVARQELACGMHVHVSVESPEEGVGVIDRVRTWLPVLLGMSANSPYWQGQDTGLDSFRAISWGRWPTAGPTELFGDLATYRRVVAQLVEAGAALDEGMIYFDARLSASYPTVEIRIADVCLEAHDAAVVAMLARALVDTAARCWEEGRAAPAVPRALVRAASWQAARGGLGGELLEGEQMRRLPAEEAVRRLLDHAARSLDDHGDLAEVRNGIERMLSRGTGATRQRRVARATGSLLDVVRDAVSVTTQG